MFRRQAGALRRVAFSVPAMRRNTARYDVAIASRCPFSAISLMRVTPFCPAAQFIFPAAASACAFYVASRLRRYSIASAAHALMRSVVAAIAEEMNRLLGDMSRQSRHGSCAD